MKNPRAKAWGFCSEFSRFLKLFFNDFLAKFFS